jgi:hypothetical protein
MYNIKCPLKLVNQLIQTGDHNFYGYTIPLVAGQVVTKLSNAIGGELKINT